MLKKAQGICLPALVFPGWSWELEKIPVGFWEAPSQRSRCRAVLWLWINIAQPSVHSAGFTKFRMRPCFLQGRWPALVGRPFLGWPSRAPLFLTMSFPFARGFNFPDMSLGSLKLEDCVRQAAPALDLGDSVLASLLPGVRPGRVAAAPAPARKLPHFPVCRFQALWPDETPVGCSPACFLRGLCALRQELWAVV